MIQKQRLLVMNGQNILQAMEGGGWKTIKTDDAVTIPPGVYNLFAAQDAGGLCKHEGLIIHIDESWVFQQISIGQIVRHALSHLLTIPAVGTTALIKYETVESAHVAPIIYGHPNFSR